MTQPSSADVNASLDADVLLLINGQWQPGSAQRWQPIEDPARQTVIGRMACAEDTDIERALSAADRSFATWRHTSARERRALLLNAAALLSERSETIARQLTLEQGKPLQQARNELAAACEVVEWFAEEAVRAYGQVIPARQAQVMQYTLKTPVGPVAAFTPWNFPIGQLVRKLCAALAAGCTLIAKAAEDTPASPAALFGCFHDAGFPAGVINLLYGDPEHISSRLITDPRIRKISFTGSTAVGKHLAQQAGRHMKRITMELGGHAPAIVCADADIATAARQLAQARFYNAGQVCITPTRILVHADVVDTFTHQFAEAARSLKAGHGLAPDTTLGPMATARGAAHLRTLRDDALAQGGKAVLLPTAEQEHGQFVLPSIVRDVPLTARVMNEEPFGPLTPINAFTCLDDAIAEANRLPYGLAAYGYSRDIGTLHRLATGIESGMLSLNHCDLADPEQPFGGLKDSGYGSEGGNSAIQCYLDERFITCNAE